MFLSLHHYHLLSAKRLSQNAQNITEKDLEKNKTATDSTIHSYKLRLKAKKAHYNKPNKEPKTKWKQQ